MTLSDNLKSNLRNETRLSALETQTKLRSKTKRKKKYLKEKTEWRHGKESELKNENDERVHWINSTFYLNFYKRLKGLMITNNYLPEQKIQIFMMQNTFCIFYLHFRKFQTLISLDEDRNSSAFIRLSYQSLNKLRCLSPKEQTPISRQSIVEERTQTEALNKACGEHNR